MRLFPNVGYSDPNIQPPVASQFQIKRLGQNSLTVMYKLDRHEVPFVI